MEVLHRALLFKLNKHLTTSEISEWIEQLSDSILNYAVAADATQIELRANIQKQVYTTERISQELETVKGTPGRNITSAIRRQIALNIDYAIKMEIINFVPKRYSYIRDYSGLNTNIEYNKLSKKQQTQCSRSFEDHSVVSNWFASYVICVFA